MSRAASRAVGALLRCRQTAAAVAWDAAGTVELAVPSTSPRCMQSWACSNASAAALRHGPPASDAAPTAAARRAIQGFARIAETEKGMTKMSGYYAGGFYINNVQVPGSVICAHDMYLMWRPRRMSEVTTDSLAFLEIIKPAPAVVVFGTGATLTPLPPSVASYLSGLGIQVELLDSRHAPGYFNVLNDEGRAVVGAMLVWDADARMPENMPQIKEPLWDRPGLLSRTGKI